MPRMNCENPAAGRNFNAVPYQPLKTFFKRISKWKFPL